MSECFPILFNHRSTATSSTSSFIQLVLGSKIAAMMQDTFKLLTGPKMGELAVFAIFGSLGLVVALCEVAR